MSPGNYYSSKPLPVTDLILMIGIAVVMIILSGTTTVFHPSTASNGFCLPSPNLWPLTSPAAWIINTILLLGCAAIWVFLNKEYTLVKGTDHLALASFLIYVGANPVCTHTLTTGSILLAVCILCLSILFGASHERNCTQQIFVIYTFLSVGSMFQYAFVPIMAVFFIASLIMKTMRAKEFIAMLLGIIAPYWVVLGLGLIPYAALHLPTVFFLFNEPTLSTKTILLIVNIAFSLTLAFIFWFSNSMVIFAGNKETRARNNVMSLIIFASALFIIFDFNNMAAYLPMFYFALSVQTGNLFAYHNIRWRRTLIWIFTALYTTGFIFLIYDF